MLAVARLSAAVSQLRVSPRSARAGAAHHSRRVRARRVLSAISTTNMTTASWVDEGDFEALREAMTTYDEQRDTVIKRARDITKASKVAIYCLHRGEIDKADAQIATAAQIADELGAPPETVREVLVEIGTRFHDVAVVATREAERRSELSELCQLMVAVPMLDRDVNDVADLLELAAHFTP